jgi:hypothetical protein
VLQCVAVCCSVPGEMRIADLWLVASLQGEFDGRLIYSTNQPQSTRLPQRREGSPPSAFSLDVIIMVHDDPSAFLARLFSGACSTALQGLRQHQRRAPDPDSFQLERSSLADVCKPVHFTFLIASEEVKWLLLSSHTQVREQISNIHPTLTF